MAGWLGNIRDFVVQHASAVTLTVGGIAAVGVVGANVANVPVPPAESLPIPAGSAPLLDDDNGDAGGDRNEVQGNRVKCVPKGRYGRIPQRCGKNSRRR